MNHRLLRREFLGQSLAGLTAVAGLASAESAMDANDQPIIDTHQHFWDLKQFKLPWVKKDSIFDKNYLPADYAKAAQGLNIVNTIYMEVDLDPSQQTAEAEYVIDLAKKPGQIIAGAVISGRPASEGFAKYLKPFKDSDFIKGVRQVLHNADIPVGTCLKDPFIKGIQLLGEWGKSFDLCFRAGELTDAAKLIEKCPGTRFILDHCGNPRIHDKDQSVWKKGLDAVAQKKNAVCKVSGILASTSPGKWKADDLALIINHVLDQFGPDRVLFAGDWPVCTLGGSLKEWTNAVKTVVHDRPKSQQEKLFYSNAVRVYGLADKRV